MTGLTDTSTKKLATDLAEIDAEIAMLGDGRKAIIAELLARHRAGIAKALKDGDKDHGKVTVKSDGFDLEAEIRQNVKWDQAKLSAAGDKMKPEEAQHLIDIELSVSERSYKALPPGDLKKSLTDARTTKLSEPSIKVVFPKEN